MKRPNIGIARRLRRNQTDAEKKLWYVLRNRSLANAKFKRQHPVDNYILDFYSPEHRLCSEADGGQHYTEDGKQSDETRSKVLANMGIRVLRFSDYDVLNNIEGVCEVIQHAIDETPPHLNPLPDGERIN